MRLPHREHSYNWIDGWAKSPDSESARTGWAHHDVVVSSTGDVITFHQADPTLLIFAPDGSYKNSWEAPVSNSHGMDIVMENEEEFLWLADNKTGKVVKTNLEGQTVRSLECPDLSVYRDGKYGSDIVNMDFICSHVLFSH